REHVAHNLTELLNGLLSLGSDPVEDPAYLAGQFLGSPSEVGFEDLTDIHSGRHAQRVEHDFHRGSVRQVGHVFFRKYPGDDTLVSMAAGHLIADGELALHRDEDFDHLDDARRQLVALLELLYILLVKLPLHADLPLGAALELRYFGRHVETAAGDLDLAQCSYLEGFEQLASQLSAFRVILLVLVDEVFGQLLAFEQLIDSLVALVFENSDLVAQILFELLFLGPFDRERPFILFGAFPGKNLNIDDGAIDARRAGQARVADVTGFFAEYRAQQL